MVGAAATLRCGVTEVTAKALPLCPSGPSRASGYEEDQPTRHGMRRHWEESCRIRMHLTGLPALERVHRKLRHVWLRRDLLSCAVIGEFGIDRFTAHRLCNFEARLGEIGRLQTSRLHENIFTHDTPASKLKTVRTS
jgi:hypothetical protein